MEKCAHRFNVILGIIKAHATIVKTRPCNVNCGNINAIVLILTGNVALLVARLESP